MSSGIAGDDRRRPRGCARGMREQMGAGMAAAEGAHDAGRIAQAIRTKCARVPANYYTRAVRGGGLNIDLGPGLAQWCRLGVEGADSRRKLASALVLAAAWMAVDCWRQIWSCWNFSHRRWNGNSPGGDGT